MFHTTEVTIKRVILYLFAEIKGLNCYYSASEASEVDSQSCSIEISDYWRASVAGETLTGVTQSKKSGMFVSCWRASEASEQL